MDWLKKNFDRALLALFGVIALACAVIILLQVTSFAENFSSRNSAIKPDNNVPAPPTALLKERIVLLEKPAEWGAHAGSLFVSEPYLIKDGGEPVNPLAEGQAPLHPPIPNDWLIKYNLDYADPGLLNADPDGDKFTNLEEFNGKTDPTSAESRPPYVTKLRLAKFVQTPFRLKFSGSPDDGQTFSINTLDLKQPTSFLKIGDTIPRTPYKIVAYNKKTEDKEGLQVDVSELIVENKDTGQKIPLIYDKPVNDPTVYADFKYLLDGSSFRVKKNDTFSVKPDTATRYKLIDISEAQAVIESPQGDKITVPKGDS